MPPEDIESVIGNAIIDKDFLGRLLGGDRAALLSKFNLTQEELQMLMGVHAESLAGFAGQVHAWQQSQGLRRKEGE